MQENPDALSNLSNPAAFPSPSFNLRWPRFALPSPAAGESPVKRAFERPGMWVCAVAALLLGIGVAQGPVAEGLTQFAIAGAAALLIVSFVWFELISPAAFALIFVIADIAVIVFG